jgi:hypothetical protein
LATSCRKRWYNFCPNSDAELTDIFGTVMFSRSSHLTFDLVFLKMRYFNFSEKLYCVHEIIIQNICKYQVGTTMGLGFVMQFIVKQHVSFKFFTFINLGWHTLTMYTYIEKYCNLYSKIPSCNKATCIKANTKLSVQSCKHSKVMRH